jgi:hypothetical protein
VMKDNITDCSFFEEHTSEKSVSMMDDIVLHHIPGETVFQLGGCTTSLLQWYLSSLDRKGGA